MEGSEMLRGDKMVAIAKCIQTNSVHSEYEALFSVICPILYGLTNSLKKDIVDQIGGYNKVSLELFTRLYQPGDGDCGICFEYAVHSAIVDGNSDVLERIENEMKNLIVCPVPYDQSFMEIFYEGWNIVRQFIKATGKMPKEIDLPSGLDRLVCKELVLRAKFPVLDVVEALKTMGQPYLMKIENKMANIESNSSNDMKINKIISPLSSNVFS